MREGFQRLRGEINGSLPRIEEKVERVIEHLNGREETEREYFEKVRVEYAFISNPEEARLLGDDPGGFKERLAVAVFKACARRCSAKGKRNESERR